MDRHTLRNPYPFHGMQSAVADDNRRARDALAAFKARQRARRNRAIAGWIIATAMAGTIAAALYLSF